MKMTDILKKYVLPNLPYLIFLWFFAKVGEAVRLAPGVDASTKLLGLADGFTLAFQTSMPGAAPISPTSQSTAAPGIEI